MKVLIATLQDNINTIQKAHVNCRVVCIMDNAFDEYVNLFACAWNDVVCFDINAVEDEDVLLGTRQFCRE